MKNNDTHTKLNWSLLLYKTLFVMVVVTIVSIAGFCIYYAMSHLTLTHGIAPTADISVSSSREVNINSSILSTLWASALIATIITAGVTFLLYKCLVNIKELIENEQIIEHYNKR